MANIPKYKDLIKLSTSYATQMQTLSNRIFGEVARPTPIKSLKVVRLLQAKPWHKNEDVVDYYHRMPQINKLMFKLRQYGLYRDEHEDFKDEMKRMRKLRGKGPPEKYPYRG